MTDHIWIYYGIITVITFLLMAWDKIVAIAGRRRIPERVLCTFSWLGGFMGSLLAMIFCRHKIRKPKFWYCNIFAFLLHIACYCFLWKF